MGCLQLVVAYSKITFWEPGDDRREFTVFVINFALLNVWVSLNAAK